MNVHLYAMLLFCTKMNVVGSNEIQNLNVSDYKTQRVEKSP